jgi:hypothetical protein
MKLESSTDFFKQVKANNTNETVCFRQEFQQSEKIRVE